jgi:serine/threonine protein kinase
MRHKKTDAVYAMKVIPLGCEEQVQQRIVQELHILHDCGPCPHIVSFHEASYYDGAVCVVLEYMDGGSLADVISAGGKIPERIVANVAGRVAHGLEFLHRKHLIHRDIKPSNILLSSRGPVKIADFGVSGELANSLAETASWCGTVTYMSPERIQACVLFACVGAVGADPLLRAGGGLLV